MKTRMRSAERGVTLVELLVAVAIVAALAAFFVSRYMGYRRQAADARVIDLLEHIRQGVTAYEARTGSFSGLPCDAGGPAYNQLRVALAPYVTLPTEGELWEIATWYGSCYLGWSDSWAYATALSPRDGRGPMFLAVQAGIYRCDGWIWNCPAAMAGLTRTLIRPGVLRGAPRGVTFVELLVVLGILAALAAVFAVRMSAARATAQEDSARTTASALAAAVSSFYLAQGCYPQDVGPGTIPAGMASYVGGEWPQDFDYEQWGSDIGVSWRPGGSCRWTVWVSRGVAVPVCP